jgi:hypothetical protein
LKTAITAIFLAISFAATAQTTTSEAPAKKDEPGKADAKAAPKKAAPPKKPVAPKKAATPRKPAEPPKTTVYKNDPNAPVIRDKDGNAVPTNPAAYDVSSAIGKK